MKSLNLFKNALFISGIFTAFIFSCTSNPKNEEMALPTQEEAMAAIKKKIEVAAEKWASGVTTGYSDYAASDITWMDELEAMIPVNGKDSLKAYLEGFIGRIPAHQHKLSDIAFQNYGDIAIVTYRYTAIIEGVPQDPWKVSAVFRYVDHDWFSVHENWSEVKRKQ